jgi:CheY-like chemotaxis protein
MSKSVKRILVVDDEDKLLTTLEMILDRMNGDRYNEDLGIGEYSFEIVTVRDGWEALQRLKEEPFDLLISDLVMPRIDGVELVEELRDMGLDTAVVWITAYGSQGLKADCRRLDVYQCLDKPLLIGEIRQAALDAMGIGHRSVQVNL